MSYTLAYDEENRLTGISGGSLAASYVYDGDGNRVKTVVNGVITIYIGNYYEVLNPGASQVVKKYYYAGGNRVAMSEDGVIRYFVTDHLGSTTKLINTDGSEYSAMRYLAWGSDRLTPPDIGSDFKYTGQREAEAGLYFYNARWYDPEVGRFIQADTIIPELGNPIAWDRYAYTMNNPINFTDPSGHRTCGDGESIDCEGNIQVSGGSGLTGGGVNDVRDATHDVELTTAGQASEALYNLHQAPGWWNNYGKDEFTLEDFLGLMLLYDISAAIGATNLITEAVGRQIWTDASDHGGHKAYCSSAACRNGILNFIGAYIASAQLRFNLTVINPYDLPYGKTGQEAIASARVLGKTILHPPASWSQYNENAPYHWGNPPTPLWASIVPYSPSVIGSAFNQVFYHGGANFVVYSIAQDNYWKGIP